ncbi:hypothetical protein PIB30_038586 [Stylosanthes scabra]|uniref:Uncharacterized protein n=1 Tax=Stylosanthes scabra TaxID=79078 RepID=A0ABU6QET0_9FABA|nr:hypothetical protein [Stylosanthes scabra]
MESLKNLKNISLFSNQFSGVIPQNLGINSSLVKLDFTNNKFTENAYVIVQSRKSDVYSYGVVLLELLTRKRDVIEEERKVTGLVSWVRTFWLETGKVEEIVDPDLANAFPNSEILARQVTKVLLLALRCTERKPRGRPTMKDIFAFYQLDIFKLNSDDVDVVNEDADDVAPEPYSVPFVSTNPASDTQSYSNLHGETSEAEKLRHKQICIICGE